MKRIMGIVVFAAISFGVSFAAPLPKELKQGNDLEKIAGKWKTESLSVHGVASNIQGSAGFQFDSNGKCTSSLESKELGVTFTLDTSATPRRLKWGVNPRGVDWQCVYELDGDKLLLAFIDAGTELPKKIEPAANVTLYTFSRIKE